MKSIRFGMLDGSIGDALTVLPLVEACDFTLEVMEMNQRAQLFKENAKVIITDSPLFESESMAKYGNKNLSRPFIHATQNFMNIYGLDSKNYIPKLKFTKDEIEFADNFVQPLILPALVIGPIIAGIKNNQNDIARQYRFMDMVNWGKMLTALSSYFTLIYTCKESDYIPIAAPHIRLHESARKTAAVLNKVKLFLGVDSGLHQLSIAAGASTFILVRSFQLSPTYCFTNYAYLPEMWTYELQRAFYYEFSNCKQCVTDLIGGFSA